MIILNILLLLAGFVALIKGADWFVDGSAALARIFKVPGVIIGLTVVAMGTSAPELAVSVSAALQGSNEIALSNVVGSNIFNLLMVLGICALIHKIPVDDKIIRRDFPLNILITVFVLISVGKSALPSVTGKALDMNAQAGRVSRATGIILLIIFVCYIVFLIMEAIKNPETKDENGKSYPFIKCLALIVIGIALIVGGGQAVVYSAKEIARVAGMSETLIGLTIVAVGTSLPELVTSIVAARKGETGMAVGNVVGSNLFNLMLILGISSAIHPMDVNLASVCDLAILTVITIFTYICSRNEKNIKRGEGLIMVILYAASMVFAALR